jgi:hypothetical protein
MLFSGTIGVLDVSCVHDYAEQQPVHVSRDVALAPVQLPGRITAAWAAALRRLHALGVNDGCRGAGVPPGALAQQALSREPGRGHKGPVWLAWSGRSGRNLPGLHGL